LPITLHIAGADQARKQAGVQLIAERLRLLITGECGGDVGTVDDRALLITVELGITIKRPPAIAYERISRLRLGPLGFFLVSACTR